jgi:hydrophobic/amphiphilic exporter-1 (mainly G- bacteria), HAE1 family
MTRFALRFPYLTIVVSLIVCVVGVTSLLRLPVDLFPAIRIPVVVVATFYSGMPPEQIENSITGRFERFFTLASGIDHIESRSLPGVSLIKIYFQPGTNPDTAVSTIANLATANLRRLPPGTLPPVVLKFDASSLPVCLITLKGEGLTETELRDTGQYAVRNQVANVPGASVPQPFGGRYRQIMVYVDPLKLESHQMSVMDVVRAVNDSNLILPAGDVRIGPLNYNIYANSQLRDVADVNRLPLKTVGKSSVMVADVGEAQDASQIQNNIVRVDGQRSVYLPVLKQGGSTIAVVNGVKDAVAGLLDVPQQLISKVVFDQSLFVKSAIKNLTLIGVLGLALTGVMILMFFGSLRGTLAVFLSIPISVLAAFVALGLGDNSVNSMVLGGFALAFSRLINNSVVVIENIFRLLELGESPEAAAEKGGEQVAMPVLASSLATAVVFFPVIFLYGVSQFLFTALALAVVFSLAASYIVALTVVPLFCAKMLKRPAIRDAALASRGWGQRFNEAFKDGFNRLLNAYERLLNFALRLPRTTVVASLLLFAASLAIYPIVGVSYFPRTDPSQFLINVKAPTGTRVEITEKLMAQVEDIIRQEVAKEDLGVIVSNIGVQPGFSSIYTSNSGHHTASVQVSLNEGHKTGSYAYMDRVRRRITRELPQLSVYLQSGGLVDAVLNLGLPAPIDIQISGSNLEAAHRTALDIARKVRALPGVSDVLVPQDIDHPALKLEVIRARAAELGLTSKEVVQNVITALTSGAMIAPSYFVDPRNGNDYLLTVQYREGYVNDMADLQAIPVRSPKGARTVRLDAMSEFHSAYAPTEVNHYQLRRVINVFVAPAGEDLGAVVKDVNRILAGTEIPAGLTVTLRGMVQGMNSSFKSFGLGLILAVVLVYLILVAQFQSFLDPLIILLAVPSALTGVLVLLAATGTTLNIMSLMGVVMVVGIVVANSILIVEFVRRLREDRMPVREALVLACRVRLRPVLVTSLATLMSLLPMAAKLGTGSEAYAPLALAIIGGLTCSLVQTVFIVPAAYLLAHRREDEANGAAPAAVEAPAA